MDKNNFEELSLPIISALNKTSLLIQESTLPIIEAVQSIQTFAQSIAEVVERLNPVFLELGQAIEAIARPMAAIEKLGEAQFVYWDYLTSEFEDDIINTRNTNKVLREYIIKDNYKNVNDTISKCNNSLSGKKYKNLFSQSIKAFQNGYSDLAVTGLTSVFDAILADISNNQTSNLIPRIDAIKEKIDNNGFLDNDEHAMLVFALTFDKTINSFSAFSDFNNKEPKGLNRHWIAHGRSTRKKTKLDCVKMLNLIYGLLLIEGIEINTSLQANNK